MRPYQNSATVAGMTAEFDLPDTRKLIQCCS